MLPKLQETSFVPSGPSKVRAVEGNKLNEFIRGASPRIMREVEQDIADNPFVRQQWKEALLSDYERSVIRGNKVDEAAWVRWKKETSRFREMIFENQDDFWMSGEFGKLREAVETSRFREQAKLDTLNKTWNPEGTDVKINFKHPSQQKMWAQFKKMPPNKRRWAMRVLDHSGLGAKFRATIKEELKNTISTKSKATNATGLNAFISEAEQIVTDVWGVDKGKQMISDLKVVRNIVQRRFDRAAIKGLPADANPTALALTRVIFGPLSRAQRFFTAARRGQVRAGAADIGDIITDPDLLRDLVAIRTFPVTSRRVQRFMQDADLLEQFWWSGEDYDINNDEHRRQVADNVLTMYYDEVVDANVER